MRRTKEVMKMCFNSVIVNLKGKNDYKGLVKSLYYEFSHNKDGIFLYNSLNGRIIREVGTDEDYRSIIDNFDFSTDTNSLIHMHLRLATRGKVNRDNVHGWNYKLDGEEYLCSHNGSYNEYKYYTSSKHKHSKKSYEGYKDDAIGSLVYYGGYPYSYYGSYLGDNSDSKEFFDKLFVALNKGDRIEKLIKDFYGVAFCTSANTILAISHDKSIKIAYLGDSLVLSNESLYTDLSYNADGYEFKIESPEVYNKMILIDIRKRKVKELYKFTYSGSWLE